MKREAIVLAGGFGTRLRSVIEDVPKPMAPIGGEPFLAHLLRYLSTQKFDHVVLSVGYLHEKIQDYFGDTFRGLTISYEIEDEPLGTGGALLASSRHVESESFSVFNGDTMFPVDMDNAYAIHKRTGADVTIVVKALENFERYGTLSFDSEQQITAFEEKRKVESGYINGGVYVLRQGVLDRAVEGQPRFSLEKDFFEPSVGKLSMVACPSDAFFLDIGVPEDYERAQHEVPRLTS